MILPSLSLFPCIRTAFFHCWTTKISILLLYKNWYDNIRIVSNIFNEKYLITCHNVHAKHPHGIQQRYTKKILYLQWLSRTIKWQVMFLFKVYLSMHIILSNLRLNKANSFPRIFLSSQFYGNYNLNLHHCD